MNTSIYFYISSSVPIERLIQFFASQLDVSTNDFLVVESCMDYWIACEEQGLEPTEKIILEYQLFQGEFDGQVELFVADCPLWEGEERMLVFLQGLSTYCQAAILADDGEFNPYTYLLIEPKGFVQRVALITDMLDAEEPIFEIEYYYPTFFGSFALKEAWSVLDLKAELEPLFIADFQCFDLDYYSAILPLEDYAPTAQKIEGYQHHYKIILQRPTPWFSIADKSALLKERLLAFAKKKTLNICLFPANYSQAITYPLGVTYEKYCWCYENGALERVVYKLPDFKT